jgi:hypothetical protein
MARALRACMWAIAQEGPLAPSTTTGASPDAVLTQFRPAIGRDAAPGWWSPRRRSEAARNPRAEIEAGPRRTHGRGDPTHGYPRDHPSSLPGSGSSGGRRTPR